MSFGIVSFDFQGLAIGRDGCFEVAQGLPCETQVIVKLRACWGVADGGADQIRGGLVLANLMREHTQKMECVGVMGLLRQHLPIDGFCFHKTSSLMMLKR